MEKKFKMRMPSDSVRLQSNNISGLDVYRKSKSEINGSSKKRKADQAVAQVSANGDKRQRMIDPSMRWKLMEQRRKRRKTGALKSAHDQPEKKQGMMTMVSVSSGSRTKRAVDFKAKSSQGSSLISTTAGGIGKINNDQENTCPSSSGDLSGVLVLSCRNKILHIEDNQVVKKALSAAMLTTRFAEIFSKAKADKADLQKERERQKSPKREEDEARKSAQIREAEQLKRKEAADLREKQREAARIALQMVEKTVELEDNLMLLKELEMLSQCSHTYVHRGGHNGPAVMMLRGLAPGSEVFNPLEELGLYMKEEEFVTDNDEETLFSREIEEGEIIEY